MEVSNWNEQKQNEERGQEYLERIHADLEHDGTTIENRLSFWAQTIDYGEGAIAHFESGTLYQGSPQKTLLAYFQASQMAPYAAVSVTYDENACGGRAPPDPEQ